MREFEIDRCLRRWAPGCEVVEVDAVTEGAACTVLLAERHIDSSDPLMIANSDQRVDTDIDAYLAAMDTTGADGLIMTMWADPPKRSYVRLNDREDVCEVVEKQVVSNEATVGIYNYRHGADFVAAERMIAKNLRVNNEFYVAPAYNEMIAGGKKIVYYNVGREYDDMCGISIPSDLAKFEPFAVSRKAVSFA